MDVFSFWKIGKFIQGKKYSCFNIHITCSNYLSYYYGNSHRFSLFHIQMMEKLYSYFPIFSERMREIRWDSYLELLSLKPKECYFYYHILLFCGDDFDELKQLIRTNLYSRI